MEWDDKCGYCRFGVAEGDLPDAVEANLRLQAENAALKAEARYNREIAEAGADAKPLIVAHNLQLMAENESLTRKLDERNDTIKRMAEGEDDSWAEMKRLEAKNDKLQSENAVLRRSNVALLQADTCRRRDLAVCEADVLALRKEIFDRKAEAKRKDEIDGAAMTYAAIRIHDLVLHGDSIEKENAGLKAKCDKLRAYVRDHGPCAKCDKMQNPSWYDALVGRGGNRSAYQAWLAIQEV